MSTICQFISEQSEVILTLFYILSYFNWSHKGAPKGKWGKAEKPEIAEEASPPESARSQWGQGDGVSFSNLPLEQTASQMEGWLCQITCISWTLVWEFNIVFVSTVYEDMESLYGTKLFVALINTVEIKFSTPNSQSFILSALILSSSNLCQWSSCQTPRLGGRGH